MPDDGQAAEPQQHESARQTEHADSSESTEPVDSPGDDSTKQPSDLESAEPQQRHTAAGYRARPVSWVRRGVRVTGGQEKAWTEHGPRYLVEPPRALARESIDPTWRFDPEAVFNHSAPLVIEIGTGQGENVVAAARRDPERNYLGVEVYKPGLARTILRAQAVADEDERPLTNLRLIQADAPELLATALPPHSVAEAWVFFPDPWPKARHRKRRMVSSEFVNLLARVLEPGGVVRLATDWADYGEQMRRVFDVSAMFEPLSPAEAERGDGATAVQQRFDGRVLTAFERKGTNAGRTVLDLAYQRK